MLKFIMGSGSALFEKFKSSKSAHRDYMVPGWLIMPQWAQVILHPVFHSVSTGSLNMFVNRHRCLTRIPAKFHRVNLLPSSKVYSCLTIHLVNVYFTLRRRSVIQERTHQFGQHSLPVLHFEQLTSTELVCCLDTLDILQPSDGLFSFPEIFSLE